MAINMGIIVHTDQANQLAAIKRWTPQTREAVKSEKLKKEPKKASLVQRIVRAYSSWSCRAILRAISKRCNFSGESVPT